MTWTFRINVSLQPPKRARPPSPTSVAGHSALPDGHLLRTRGSQNSPTAIHRRNWAKERARALRSRAPRWQRRGQRLRLAHFRPILRPGRGLRNHRSDQRNPAQFIGIGTGFENLISENYNVGRGRKSIQSPKDVLFMTLSVLKHGGTWDFLAKMFGQKTPAFERLIVRFVRILSEHLYGQYVTYRHTRWSMKALSENNKLFKEYPMARYATDVTFQPCFRPSGSLEEGKNILVANINSMATKSKWVSRWTGLRFVQVCMSLVRSLIWSFSGTFSGFTDARCAKRRMRLQLKTLGPSKRNIRGSGRFWQTRASKEPPKMLQGLTPETKSPWRVPVFWRGFWEQSYFQRSHSCRKCFWSHVWTVVGGRYKMEVVGKQLWSSVQAVSRSDPFSHSLEATAGTGHDFVPAADEPLVPNWE